MAYNTVQEVYDVAIRLMDAQNESTGATDTSDNKEYRLRTPSLLNSILDEAYQAANEFEAPEGGGRPIADKVSAMTDTIEMDSAVCLGLLPYGLAGLLISEENPTLANFFWQTFQEKLDKMKRSVCAEIEAVENPYGGIGFGEFSVW